ncbi:MAG: hypothetical protein WBO46_08280, partial [Caldilineaceae bacterium]
MKRFRWFSRHRVGRTRMHPNATGAGAVTALIDSGIDLTRGAFLRTDVRAAPTFSLGAPRHRRHGRRVMCSLASIALLAAMAACHGKPPPQGTERLVSLQCPAGELQVLSFASLPAGACDWSVDPPMPPPTDHQPITDEPRNRGWLPPHRCSRVFTVQACSLDLGAPEGGALLYCKDAASKVHGPLEVLYQDGSARSQIYCNRG